MKDSAALRLEDVLAGRPFIEAKTRVSAKSCFFDDQWDFTNNSVARLSSVPESRLRINWGMYCADAQGEHDDHRSALITKMMVEELKIFSYLYLNLPSAFGLHGTRSAKPQTLVVMVRALVCLFSDVLQRYQLDDWISTTRHLSPIQSITDLSLRAISTTLADSPRADGVAVKKGLKLLASPVMKAAFQQRTLQWNTQDIKALPAKTSKKRNDYLRVMPNDLFRLLSNTACSDVLGFLRFIGEEAHDKSGKPFEPKFSNSLIDGAALISDYIALRQDDREFAARTGKKRTGPSAKSAKFKRNYGVGRKQVFSWLYRVQRAAFTVIGLYTGARYSDLTTFTNQCIQLLHGVPVLTGTHIKHQALDAPEGVDLWPAIPIMRDAVTCLEYIARATFNPFLLSASETVPLGTTPRALSLNGFTGAITNYLHEIDTSNRWADWSISAHQLRHTLAHQLARADVGLLFIAHQLKHLHTALHALPPNVTMMYGNVGDLATQRALHSDSAYREAAQELYNPDRPVAGGGAEAFIERRKAYFEGMAAQGWTVDEVIENLAKQGLPFASVGIGYCGGRRDTLLKDGKKDTPPCIGSLQCNPGVCKQAVITRTHAPVWRKILDQNRELAATPRMAHAKELLLASVQAAEQVLAQLGQMAETEQS
ncbi:hypothetical protein [uncultured Dechloromonas sp.]|uniref:hypothetical protein n=1 Tax=uncultured Dechloromonas sp. TaxID=171719 RepID=UPI0025F3D411|nr:hypothetical protein [uncultured Dechloromonas sp.]